LGELERETYYLGKRLKLRDRDETWWKKSISPRYVIDITGTGLLSFGELAGG